MAARKAAAAPADPLVEADAAAAVAAQGEIVLRLKGVAYVLRPSFAAIGAIETETGRTLFDLAAAAERCQLPLVQAGVVAAHCIRAHAAGEGGNPLHRDVKPETLAGMIYAEDGGVLLATKVALHPLLFGALTGGFTALGEPKPRTTTK